MGQVWIRWLRRAYRPRDQVKAVAMFGRKRRRGPSERFVTYSDDPTFGAAPVADEPHGLLKPWTGDAQGQQAAGLAAGARVAYQGLFLGK